MIQQGEEKLAYLLYESYTDALEFTFEAPVLNRSAGHFSVLIVSNDPVEKAHLAGELNRAGYKLLLASDQQQVINLIDTAMPPQLILIDTELPHMSAYRLIEYVRTTCAWRDIPIIAIAPQADNLAAHALRTGANSYLVKPCKADTLIGRVQDTIELHQQQSALKCAA
jgi:CheY-like chemotaxis protein